ncbi:hypothetical protein BB8028_0003g14400 [Beauveria bassiana]|uniref:Secreted protein n=1 Tax=Beauveria bassiana TaxID=176275 RepID=A0A2S7Y9J7_BEABA|nr:hypothetical protein BB8028_0003g14400 [Beauveria bassiana]
MKLLGTVATTLGITSTATATGPTPSNVRIKGVSVLGSGCPAGTADVQVDATGTLFEATFSAYEVQTGPGTQAVHWRRNCKLTLNMEFDQGYQFSVLGTNGFAEIPKGAPRRNARVPFSFTGTGGRHIEYSVTMLGLYRGYFDIMSHPSSDSWVSLRRQHRHPQHGHCVAPLIRLTCLPSLL